MGKQPKQGTILNSREHVLARPDMYIGSVDPVDSIKWTTLYEAPEEEENGETSDVENAPIIHKKKGQDKIIKEMFENYNNGFSRIHVEGFSNAIDNKWESENMGVKMTYISVNFSEESSECTIENDGRWVPIEEQTFEYSEETSKGEKKIKRKAYPLQVYFTELRSGTNYNDEDERKTSGRNGVGIKACIFFSKYAEVTSCDPQNKLKQTLVCENNCTKIILKKPEKYNGKTGKVTIKFQPDFSRFSMENYNSQWIRYFKKYCYDMAMLTGLKVSFNGENLAIKNMKTYAQLVVGKKAHMIETSGSGCRVILAEKETTFYDNKLSHISFANGIYTSKGGVHVNTWKDKLLGQIRDALNKTIKIPKGFDEKKIPKYSIDYFSSQFVLFVTAEVDKPRFDSQEKQELVSPKITLQKDEGKFTTKELDTIMKWDFVSYATDRWNAELDKVYKKVGTEQDKIVNPKVRMANWANTGKKNQTIFCLTEGDSGKALVDTGASSIENGYNIYGSFPLRGKLLNALKNSSRKINLNKEINTIKSSLRLRKGLDYTDKNNIATLSHGGLRVCTDSDSDGTHILFLILAYLFAEYPSLFSAGYVSVQIFPKASKMIRGKKVFYYTVKDYEGVTGVKFYKGLGTFRNEDAEEFFSNSKIIVLVPSEEDVKWMNIAMGGNNESDNRKKLIVEYLTKKLIEKTEIEEYCEGRVKIPQYIKGPLSMFFEDALTRATPSFVDGLKESQRKILYTFLKKNIYMNNVRSEGSRKLIALQGLVLQEADYHHGDTALSGGMINMAQGYVGKHNIPWLYNDGQYGDRHGNESAQARYLNTALDPIIKALINKDDFPILNYKTGEETEFIEPEWYLTCIPMILVNGSKGIAVGYSNEVLSYNPIDIMENICRWIDEEEIEEMTPWYRNFTGKIFKDSKSKGWYSTGVFNTESSSITELPIKVKTQDFKKNLWEWHKEAKSQISRITEHHGPNSVLFQFEVTKGNRLTDDTFSDMLISKLNQNMWLIGDNGMPIYYESVEKYLEDWCEFRLKWFEKRKKYWLKRLKFEKEKAEEQVRFIQEIVNDTLILRKKNKSEQKELLEEKNYKRMNGDTFSWDEEGTYEYLLDIKIHQQSVEEVEKFEKQAEEKRLAYKILKSKTPKDLWKEDLDFFAEEYDIFLEKRNNSDNANKNKKKVGKKPNKK